MSVQSKQINKDNATVGQTTKGVRPPLETLILAYINNIIGWDTLVENGVKEFKPLDFILPEKFRVVVTLLDDTTKLVEVSRDRVLHKDTIDKVARFIKRQVSINQIKDKLREFKNRSIEDIALEYDRIDRKDIADHIRTYKDVENVT